MADNDDDDEGPNPLFGAVTEGRSVDAVRSMVHSHPEWVRQRDQHGWLPLHRALEANNADAGVVRCLVAAHPWSVREWTGPNSSHSDDNNDRGWLPLHLACESGSDLVDLRCLVEAYPEAVREKGGSGDRGMYPLDCDIQTGGARIEAIHCLLDACPDAVERSHASGIQLLHWAVQSTGYGGPKLDVVQLLVERVPSCVHELDEEGRLPIHWIHQLTPVEVARLLVEKHPESVLERDHAGCTPLHRAVTRGRYMGQGAGTELVEFLVESGPEALQVTSNDGSLPLHLAVRNRLAADAIRFLVSRLPESVRTMTHKGDLPLHEAAVQHLDAVPVLLEQWPESGLVPAANGWPALHLAIQASPPGSTALMGAVREMIRLCPASVRIATSQEGFLPLHVAAKRAFPGRRVARAATEADAELVRYMAEQAPEAVRVPSRDGSIPLHHAVQRISHPDHSLPAVRTFLELWPESALVGDRDGSTAVHLAVAHQTPALDMVRLLLRDRPHTLLETTDKNGSTPLHAAVSRCDASWELVQYLVEHRPEAARKQDKKGLAPLHVAALNDAPVDVLYLLARKDPEAVHEAKTAALDCLPPPCSRPCRRPRLE